MVYLTPGNPNKRLKKVVAFVLGLAVVFGIRLVDLQIIEADAINAKSYEKRAVTRVIPALRGSILDANGEVLARTVFRYDINVAPSKVAPVSRTVDGKSVEVSVDEIAGEIGIRATIAVCGSITALAALTLFWIFTVKRKSIAQSKAGVV